jgi:hypothetical protein
MNSDFAQLQIQLQEFKIDENIKKPSSKEIEDENLLSSGSCGTVQDQRKEDSLEFLLDSCTYSKDENTKEKLEFTRLPQELKYVIFYYLNLEDLEICTRVCWEWKTIAESKQVWDKLYGMTFHYLSSIRMRANFALSSMFLNCVYFCF